MSTKLQAVEEFKKTGRLLRSILNVVDELEKIGSIEQAEGELIKRHAAAKAEMEKTYTELATAQGALKEAQAEAARILAEAEAAAAEKATKAKDDSDDLIWLAKEKALEITAAANKSKADLDGQIEAAKNELAAVKSEVVGEFAKLAALKSEIERIKASLR